jgi:hypothetical protein
MYQREEPKQRYVRQRKSRKKSSMMMFFLAAALLVTGGAFGTPWLTSVFANSDDSSSASEVGLACPQTLVGLTLTEVDGSGNVVSQNNQFYLQCNYVLEADGPVVATVTVNWVEDAESALLERGCGQPPASVPGVFTAEGSNYGVIGMARADYTGQRRYVNAMQDLGSDMVKLASKIAYPCPGFESLPRTGDIVLDERGAPIDGISQAPLSNPPAESTAGASATQSAGSVTGTPGASGGVATVAPGSAQATVTVPAGSCIVSGRATDSGGVAVSGVMISLNNNAGASIAETFTSERGEYVFTQPLAAGGSVALAPTDLGRGSTFRIYYHQAPATLARLVTAGDAEDGECVVDFDVWNLDSDYRAVDSDLEEWPSIIELYQNFNSAAGLAELVSAPLDYGLPLPIFAWCDSATLFCDPSGKAEFAFYSGSSSGRDVQQPYIALGIPSSEIGYRGAPDNREFHEYGHAFMADVLGDRVPTQAGDSNHGGYFRNSATTDSWTEGFAEFYSVMVSKHIVGDANPERYRIGAEYDIEENRMPWEAIGWWEEFTLAGLLLDLEDGDSDYAAPIPDLSVESVATLNAATGKFAIGRVRNTGSSVSHDPEVTVQLVNAAGEVVFTQVTAIKPQTLGPGQTGVFYVAAPEGIEFKDIEAAPGRPAGVDDDPVDLDLERLMRVITSNWGQDSFRIESIADLYDAVSTEFAGADLDGDGSVDVTQDDIDAVFLKHGFFEDLDGDRAYQAESDGSIGLTSHPAAVVSRTSFPEFMPRRSADGFAPSQVNIDTAGIDADLLVQVEFTGAGGVDSYSYWTSQGTLQPVELAVPASGQSASVTVIASAEGHDPAVAYRTQADTFNAAVDSGEIPNAPQKSSVALKQGSPLAVLGSVGTGGPDAGSNGDGSSGGPPWMMLLPLALAGLMLAGGFYVMRRSGNGQNGSTTSKGGKS